ncbi:hypothetical protein BX600DRAFT_517913 [Xylariales sp. PMI_506]|nr:hypothetical protein BX600DRAFT_517913 [Xylariales sp. PMI_506]
MPRPKKSSTPAPAEPVTPASALATLKSLSSQEINILKLSEPISSTIASANNAAASSNAQRTSDISTSSLDAPTPASLEADLTHYRELFAKLRFSYVEQVTKEKFIRAIVGDPPLIVSAQENAELEEQNAAAKAALKALKTEVSDMVAKLEAQGSSLAHRHEAATLEAAKLEALPAKIAGLEEAVERLRAAQEGSRHPDPEMNLPLSRTLDAVAARKRKRDELARQLEQLQGQAPRKKKELDRLQAELVPLEAKRQNSSAAAREARRRKEAALGGAEDDLEERGRWFRAAETGLRKMLEI